jgi:hypothetical protein
MVERRPSRVPIMRKFRNCYERTDEQTNGRADERAGAFFQTGEIIRSAELRKISEINVGYHGEKKIRIRLDLFPGVIRPIFEDDSRTNDGCDLSRHA